MTTCTHSAVSMLTDFFSSDDIEAAARRTGFVKRVSKLTRQTVSGPCHLWSLE